MAQAAAIAGSADRARGRLGGSGAYVTPPDPSPAGGARTSPLAGARARLSALLRLSGRGREMSARRTRRLVGTRGELRNLALCSKGRTQGCLSTSETTDTVRGVAATNLSARLGLEHTPARSCFLRCGHVPPRRRCGAAVRVHGARCAATTATVDCGRAAARGRRRARARGEERTAPRRRREFQGPAGPRRQVGAALREEARRARRRGGRGGHGAGAEEKGAARQGEAPRAAAADGQAAHGDSHRARARGLHRLAAGRVPRERGEEHERLDRDDDRRRRDDLRGREVQAARAVPRQLSDVAAVVLFPGADAATPARLHERGHLPRPARQGLATEPDHRPALAVDPVHAQLGEDEGHPDRQLRARRVLAGQGAGGVDVS
mmetsp:Transcript_22258/g.69735  ORF Transcript_22258/g.69735 Transcript_22258/m.69735 type:complete len:378 (+) Transcript_22258:888-2021(+)